MAMVPLDVSAWPIQLQIAVGVLLLGYIAYLVTLYGRDKDKFRTTVVLVGYVAVFGFAFAFSYQSTTYQYLHFAAFSLGALTAFAEIIQKFGDEPLQALGTFEALMYHALNGLISVAALSILLLYPEFYEKETAGSLEMIQIVLVAGLGSMLVMRSKLFNVKMGESEIAFGPEQIINVFLRFMEDSIDRVRASARIDFVIRVMNNLAFEMIEEYTLTMLESTQALADKKNKLIKDIKDIKNDNEITNTQLRSYRLGFLLLNTMGENFLERLFESPDAEWFIEAPGVPESTVWHHLPWVSGQVNFFAYGLDMSPDTLAIRLKWLTEAGGHRLPERVGRATLSGYRLAFGSLKHDTTSRGSPNIVKDSEHEVQGVLYRLPTKAMEFLDHRMPGYRREKIKVKNSRGSDVDAETFIATVPVVALKPDPEFLERFVATGKQQGLNNDYLDSINQNLAGA